MREVGDIVAVEPRPDYLPGLYCRARVVSVLSETRVKVKLIDVGDFMEFYVYALFDLPDSLKVYPHLTVDLFLSGLKPPARDCDWLPNADQFSRIWVERAMTNSRINEKNFIHGEIQMKVNHCLWMTNIKYSGWRGKSSVESSLGFELLSRQLAEPNSDDKTRLRNLFEIAGITEQGAGAATEIGEQQWAELPRNVYSNVEVLSAQNPQCIYLRHKSVADRLDLLTADIQHFAETSSHVKKGTLDLGSICLALSNNIWRRAKIYKISSDLEILEVFFVDEGCSGWVKWDEVMEIPQSFMKRLPFQAIECELSGMKEPNEGWVESAIFDITNFKAFRKPIQAHVIEEKGEKEPVMGEKKYSIVLIDANSSRNIIINRALHNWGFAKRQPQEGSIDELLHQFEASSLQEEED
ncbi:putative ATP-dependent RNA helicase TDRD12 [Nilaparvata lugens]|uniref:putative ATP-dependent RNA helicase TDRD12 n=1 Tax=Nilaparvata lugens TaxID=108931 RepID=UPI00193D3DED|nr:putative ATP-dependent RNA helicase TDRD12 [Nilaparvata lugens]